MQMQDKACQTYQLFKTSKFVWILPLNIKTKQLKREILSCIYLSQNVLDVQIIKGIHVLGDLQIKLVKQHIINLLPLYPSSLPFF